MSRLCEDLHPNLTSSVLSSLFKKSIHNCLCFITTNPSLLSEITGLQYNQILEIKDRILVKYSSHLRFGDELYRELLSHAAIIPTGIDNLDKLLDCGFITGNIYELCGFASSGKTQICMTIAVNIITSPKQQQIFYIDTKNDISAQRLADLIESRNVPNIGETLLKIKICQIRTSSDLLECLHQLHTKLKESYLGFRVIIIDSLSVLFSPTHTHENMSLLNNLANLLKYITVEYHMVVMLTNYVTSWTTDEIEGEDDEALIIQQIQQPALGKYWAHVPNVRIMVKRSEASNECFLVMLKSSNQPVGKSIKVTIGDKGVS